MKILVSVDIEGVAGVCHAEQGRSGNPEYERARRWMAQEANAAIAGAFDGGATQVYVNDSHGSFRNMPPDMLDERAHVIQGKPRYLGMAAGVELGVAGMCMVGYHARAGSAGVLAHTINSFAFAAIEFNGQAIGEAGIYAALAGEFGVPVVMASGDDVFIAETTPLLPGAVFVETKRALGPTAAVSLSPAQSCAAIRAGAAAAVAAPLRCRPLVLGTPLSVTLHAQSPALADLFCQWPTLGRAGPTEIRFSAPSVQAAVRMLNSCSAMSFMLR